MELKKLFAVLIMLLFLPARAFAQDDPAAWAEAMQQANLRAGPGIDYAQVGQIVNGTRHPVLMRHALYPWLLIELPDGSRGWVFQEIVTITGSLQAVPVTENASNFILNTPTLTRPPAQAASSTPQATHSGPTATPIPASAVTVIADNEVNVRLGPGVDFVWIGTMTPDTPYPATRRHANFPWVEIEHPASPNGHGWVFLDIVTVQGDLYALPATALTEIGGPTLTPTPPLTANAASPWGYWPALGEGGTVKYAPDLAVLGEQLSNDLLARDFNVPGTRHIGSLFLLDLASGQAIELNSKYAYSGMSITKIAIMLTVYRILDSVPTPQEAGWMTASMTCSDNSASNVLLRMAGNGDEHKGAEKVTETLHMLNLTDSFITTPYVLNPDNPPRPGNTLITSVDQQSTEPDPVNQLTVDDAGWLLAAIYRCAETGEGPIPETFNTASSGIVTQAECARMITAMKANVIGDLIEAGVPQDVEVAHKHGWIADAHGDAGIIFGEERDFVLVMALYQPDWLSYEIAWPTIAEMARSTYNALNPSDKLAATHPRPVPEECNLSSNPLVADLMQPYE